MSAAVSVRELFSMAARAKGQSFSSIRLTPLVATARLDDGAGGDNGVQRTILEIIDQLDGLDARGNIKILMATNRPDVYLFFFCQSANGIVFFVYSDTRPSVGEAGSTGQKD